MDRDPTFASEYLEKVQTFIDKGFARKLSTQEAAVETSNTFYLPHFMAYNEKKANKYRFVFDAAAKVRGKSLNDHLLQGPDKMPLLVGVLLQFRQKRVGITADIKDFFPRVKVRDKDFDAQRFLWRGMDRKRIPDVMRMESLIFGASCSPSCATEAKEKNAFEFKDEYPAAYEAIVKKHYVDDYLDSYDSIEEAIKMQKEITEIHSRGGFQLCNWLSSSNKVLTAIPQDLHAKSLKSFDGKEDLVERVLGMVWRPDQDDFTFSMKFLKAKEDIMKGNKIPTKREVLSLVMSLFDPLGFLGILTVKAKMLLQTTWRAKISWDDLIPNSICEQWKWWLRQLVGIHTFQLPRCYSLNFTSADNIQLHVFGDASEEAFGAVAYLRIRKGQEVETALVMSKSKVAPLKPLSIPRLELEAAVLCARLARFIQSHIEVPIHRTIYWTDSTTVLGWIRADGRRYQQFVATRIGTIQELSEVIQWKWVPTQQNVADEITRFVKPCDWEPTSRWIKGPSFLVYSEEGWPQEKSEIERPELELKKEVTYLIQNVIPIVDPSRFSSWNRMLRSTAYVFRFLRKKFLKKKFPTFLSLKELDEAKSFLLSKCQKKSFPEEVELLKRNQAIDKKIRLFKLSPRIQDGMLVVGGRLDNANCLKSFTKHPIILDRKNPYVRLLLDHFHNQCGHHGQERIANEIRQEYLVISLRTAVRSAQSRCQPCKNRKAVPIPPEMGQLPLSRLERHVRPFINTGLDYFGPVEVIVKRGLEKRYVALFTCLSTRAIHLEIAGSLSTDSCIMAMRRFISRRGYPTSISSDNGTNFIGANTELKIALEEIDQDKIEIFCTTRKIFWKFNPPSAPNMGGSWERMVRAVKTAMGDTLSLKTLHEEVLHTVLIEAEHTVNSHPLTHVPDDPSDEEALTPNHFLIGRTSNLQPCGTFGKDELFGRKQWRIFQHMTEHFWKRLVKEYLPTLLRREKWCTTTDPIKVDDIVLEVNSNLP